jgi:hypothetical protein
MDVADWLGSLGLERYEAAFRDNDVDPQMLPNLTADDLKEIGIASRRCWRRRTRTRRWVRSARRDLLPESGPFLWQRWRRSPPLSTAAFPIRAVAAPGQGA